MVGSSFALNPRVNRSYKGLFAASEYERVSTYYNNATGIQETPLRTLSNLAATLGLETLLVKDESNRAGLQAFKILGAAYAVNRLMETGTLGPEAVLACASSGNHGRAIARVARDHQIRAVVYLPAGTITAQIEAIELEGASTVVVDGSYEDAVRQLAKDSTSKGWTIISDTSWPGYEEIPRWIMAGYSRILTETELQLGASLRPDVVLVQVGVGGLAGGLASWLTWRYGTSRPFLVGCVPAAAPCLLESIRAGRIKIVRAATTRMAGLLCQELSHVAWPVLSSTLDAVVAINDGRSTEASHLLAHPTGDDPPLQAGPSRACSLGTLLAILREAALEPVAKAARLGQNSRVLLVVTEGMTDPTFRDTMI